MDTFDYTQSVDHILIQQQYQQQKEKRKITNKYIIQHILQEEFISFFRADIKPTIAAQRAKQDTEEFKQAAANSANKAAKTETISSGECL